MKKLPANLYHFTSPIHLGFIREDGYIKLTDSNLKIDDATYRIEPMYRNGKLIGEHAVNKYSNYHPVVWLTANADAVADENGLSRTKTQCRLTIPTKGRRWKFLKWTDFLSKYNAAPLIAKSLKQGGGADWRNWYVCEEPIPVSEFSAVETLQPDGSYAAIEQRKMTQPTDL